jgi:CubicO group peptidase (beta-lactamase class C family)
MGDEMTTGRPLLMSVLLVAAISCKAQNFHQAADLPSASPSSPELYFPTRDGTWETVEPRDVGWNQIAIEDALSFAKKHNTSAIVVLHRGRIFAERYWDLKDDTMMSQTLRYQDLLITLDHDGRPIEDIASVQKSIVSFLVAVARDRGLADIEAPVSTYLKQGWSAAPPNAEKKILVRHLLTMSSGLSTELRFEAEAGTKWFYNTRAYSRLVDVLAEASGMTVADYTKEWLTGPIGMADSGWQPRPWLTNQDANTIGFSTSARDLAKFGLLVLAGGAWNGHRLLDDANYLRESLHPSQEMNPSYGFLWWVNDSGSFIPTAPDDLVAALGAGDRKLYVIPSLGLVVARLGAKARTSNDGNRNWKFFDREFLKLLLRASPTS